MNDRRAASNRFLNASGWGDATRAFLAGDASDRSYDRLTRAGETAVLMDAPPGTGDDPAAFIAIARHLQKIGLSAPRLLAQNLDQGFLLLEDLGDALFAHVVKTNPEREASLYSSAAQVLIHLQAHPAPPGLPNLTAVDWAEAAAFAVDWYAYAATGIRADKTAFVAALAKALSLHADGPRVLILRDFHAENLLDLPERSGIRSVGLLDFQLAQMGQPGYDLVSLLQDARRDVSPDLANRLVAEFAAATGRPLADFQTEYAVLGAQRALRILGVFARLCLVGGKSGYVPMIPRVWAQLQHNLSHPALADLRSICTHLLPPPTAGVLQTIGEKCAPLSR
ncbi:aminoglycoside phosphotransferase family protein [Pseudorhodobacter sp. MZDSW-24AT]|uniref:aminoglycoside phosphotransferase family protein n=1 Tax=Pseudorhodobacter sp. MZDSW-24AT TaxID=2052957 RepID=UPI000C1EA8E8|nr:phosphotransferase [Pseudorhodobacter sp. MZDSW-24AT]PJF09965.1 aminoglycoside phosphotransferase [Pseudorhodobacter sp. MZDSW-24AT]